MLQKNPHDQRGSSLLFVLVALIAMSAVTTAAMQNSLFDEKMMSNYEQGIRALITAESGLHYGFAQLQIALQNNPDVNNQLTISNSQLLNHISFNKGHYTVSVLDNNDGDNDPFTDSDNTILLRSVGTVGTATRSVEAVIWYTNPAAALSVLVNGFLQISGNPNIDGQCGGIHANGSIEVAGDTTVAQDVSATQGIQGENKITAGGSVNGNADAVGVPPINPADYRQYADYILASDGKVYDKNNNVVANTNSAPWHGWEKTGTNHGIASWQMPDDNTINQVTLYVEGDVDISGNPYQNSGTWEISIIAERSIRLQGNPTLTPNATGVSYSGYSNLLMLAGGDIQISGNPLQSGVGGNTLEGFIAAGEQIDISGVPVLQGAVIAENKQTDANHLDLVSFNKISGDLNITANACGGSSTVLVMRSLVEL